MRPKVTVIVPIYNVAPYLEQCVDSIRNQTLKDIEIILVDDGSIDNCPQICDCFEQEDGRIRVFHQANQGVSVARNLGIQMASGEWIMFVDGDDWLEPGAVELLYQKSLTISCEMVAASRFKNHVKKQQREEPNLEKCSVFSVNKYDRYLLGATLVEPFTCPKLFPPEMEGTPFLGGPVAKIYKYETLVNNNITFPVKVKHSEDRMFNIEMISCSSQICVLTTPIYHYRARASSACNASLEGRYINTNGCALIDHLTLYEDRIDEIFIQKYAIDWAIGCIDHLCKNGKLSLGQSILDFEMFLRQHPVCKQSIYAASYQIMPTKKKKIKLYLLKHGMYRAILLLQSMWNKIKGQPKFYP